MRPFYEQGIFDKYKMAEYSYKHFLKTICFYPNLVVISFFSLILPYLGSANLVLLAGYLVHLKFIIIFCLIVITYIFFFGHPQFTIHASSNL